MIRNYINYIESEKNHLKIYLQKNEKKNHTEIKSYIHNDTFNSSWCIDERVYSFKILFTSKIPIT